MNKSDIIIGQECVCPDGLGKVAEIINGVTGSYSIKVDTYIDNRSCHWASHNVKLVKLKQLVNLK